MIRSYRTAFISLSLIVAALAMWLWLRNFDVSTAEMAVLIDNLNWWSIAPLFALVAGHVALSSWRWSIIEGVLAGERPPFGPAYTTGALAQALGTFLPSPLVHAACRGMANRMNGENGLRGAFSGGLDQLADFAVVLLMAVPAAFALAYRDIDIYLLGAALIALIGLGLTILLPALCRSFRRFSICRGKAAILLRFDHPILLKLYGISLLRLANLTGMNLVVHAAIGTATIDAILVGVPLVALATSVAMLPGAFGVSEWSFSAIFDGFGVDPVGIVLFVLANRILFTGVSLAVAATTLLMRAPSWLRRRLDAVSPG